jgi:phage shock protein C
MRDYRERRREGLYRARDGMIFGVCKGIARHLDVSVGLVRFLTVIAFIFTGIWPTLVLYIVAAFLMKPEPVMPFESLEDREFYDSYVSSRSMALHRLKQTYDRLDRRVRRMEDIVTRKDFDWEQRLNQ